MKLTWIQPDNLHVLTDFNVQQILCDDNNIADFKIMFVCFCKVLFLELV